MKTSKSKRQAAEAMRVAAAALMGEAAGAEARRDWLAGTEANNQLIGIAADALEAVGSCQTFASLLLAPGDYRPTIRTGRGSDPRAAVAADLYDFFQARRGDPRRAFRG